MGNVWKKNTVLVKQPVAPPDIPGDDVTGSQRDGSRGFGDEKAIVGYVISWVVGKHDRPGVIDIELTPFRGQPPGLSDGGADHTRSVKLLIFWLVHREVAITHTSAVPHYCVGQENGLYPGNSVESVL